MGGALIPHAPSMQGIVHAKNPRVQLLDVAKDAVVYPVAGVMSQLYPHNPDVFILARPPPGCTKSFLKVRHASKSFMQVFKLHLHPH